MQYPGNVQGRTPKEAGSRGGLLVTIDGSKVSAVSTVFLPLSAIDWEDVLVDDLDDVSDAARLERRVRERVEEVRDPESNSEDRMVRIILTGPTPLAVDLLREEYLKDVAADLKSSIGTLDVEVVCRDIRPPIDIEEYRDGQHVLSEVLTLLDDVAADDALLNELAPDSIADVNSSAVDRTEYLRELLKDMGAEAAARLLVEDK
jgi:exonuclease SbcD